MTHGVAWPAQSRVWNLPRSAASLEYGDAVSSANRRNFLKFSGAAVLGGILSAGFRGVGAEAATLSTREYGGSEFTGWDVVVGDGIYSAPGEPPVAESDIETVNYGSHSELSANLHRRGIMAHNLTYQRITDPTAFEYIHTAGYRFRLPYLPSPHNTDLNAQTIEGGLSIWDGSNTRLDYGLGFQWLLNPWADFGQLCCWTNDADDPWEPVGVIAPDTEWHEVRLVVDFRRETTAFSIDGIHYPARFAATPKSDSWGSETAARVQAEIISIWPGVEGNGALHKVEFKDWYWLWQPHNSFRVFMPAVAR